jgi:hypothetical protein
MTHLSSAKLIISTVISANEHMQNKAYLCLQLHAALLQFFHLKEVLTIIESNFSIKKL